MSVAPNTNRLVCVANTRTTELAVWYLGDYDAVVELEIGGGKVFARVSRGMYEAYVRGGSMYVWDSHILN